MEAIPLLVKMLDSGDGEVQAAAANALLKLVGHSKPFSNFYILWLK
jgi:HEAT repeat protein